jgi:hypothetical protein
MSLSIPGGLATCSGVLTTAAAYKPSVSVASAAQHQALTDISVASTTTTSDMSRREIELRQEIARLMSANLELGQMISHLEAITKYGEQGDEPVAFTDENVAKKPFPCNALRHTKQRIGLFVPR